MTLKHDDFKPKRRVRFADSVGLELASIFLFDLINLANKKAIAAHSKPLGVHTSKHKLAVHCAGGGGGANGGSGGCGAGGLGLPGLGLGLGPGAAGKPQVAVDSKPKVAPSSFSCQFIQPVSLLSFKERVKINKVHLETCQISCSAPHNAPHSAPHNAPPHNVLHSTPHSAAAAAAAEPQRAPQRPDQAEPAQVSITTVIRVLNCSYNKAVTLRYTTDEWRTHKDIDASYVTGSSDGWSDKFSARIELAGAARALEIGQRIIFCLRYTFDGAHTHWDNNGGLNYSIKVS